MRDPPTPATRGARAGRLPSHTLATVMEPAAPPHAEPSTDPSAGTFQPAEPSSAEVDGTFQAGVTIDQAAAILNTSPSTVRRWVKEGKVRSKRVTTPQGHAFRVHLDGHPPSVETSNGRRPSGESAPAVPPVMEPATASMTAPSIERAEAMTRYNEALLAPLVAELAAARLGLLTQADRIAELARENGTLAERMAGLERVRDAAMAHAAELEAKLAVPPAVHDPQPAPDPFPVPNPPTPNAEPSRWRRWWLALAGANVTR